MERPHERLLGTALLAIGLAILLFAFYHDYTLLSHVPSPNSTRDPQAQFSWTVSGYTVTLTDRSQPGSAPISSTYWAFADGNTTSTANVSHTYSRAGNYNVTLIVEDKNGNAAESAAPIHVGPGAAASGTGSPSYTPGGSLGSVLGGVLGGSLGGIAATVETFILLAVMWMVGGTILKAGWNLITPKAETIQVRVKPKSLAIEGAGYSAMPASAAPSPVAPPSGGPVSSAQVAR